MIHTSSGTCINIEKENVRKHDINKKVTNNHKRIDKFEVTQMLVKDLKLELRDLLMLFTGNKRLFFTFKKWLN